MIREFFGDGKRFGISIEYVEEDEPLGTAGALSLIHKVPTKAFVVSNGDVLTDICLLYTSPSPRDDELSRMPSSA